MLGWLVVALAPVIAAPKQFPTTGKSEEGKAAR